MLTDLRYALRSLRKQPGVTAIVTLSLGAGIALNVTLFALVNAVLLRPPAVEAPEELVRIFTTRPGGEGFESSSYLDYLDLRDHNEVLTGLAAHANMLTSYVEEGRSKVVLGELVSGNYFELLGVRAQLGRTIGEADVTAAGADAVTVLDHDFWRTELGSRTDVVGDSIRLNGRRYTVLGVLAPEFDGLMPGITPAIYVPVTMANDVEPAGQISAVPSPTGSHNLDRRGFRFLWMVGRLQPGIDPLAADAQLDSVMAGLAAEHPATNDDLGVSAISTRDIRLHPELDRVLGPAAAVLLLVAGVVLLVVCGNVANMLLARASRRRSEVALRVALGASRGQIVRQLLAESICLSALGGTLGLAMGWAATRLLAGFQPRALPIQLSLDLPVDARVAGFTFLLTAAAALVFGLAPALLASRTDVVRQMRRDEIRPRRASLGQVLVAGQVALCLTLLVAAGLLVRSLLAVSDIDLGLRAERLGLVTTDLGMIGHEGERAAATQRRMLEAVRAVPGVEAAAWAQRVPFDVNLQSTALRIEGFNEDADRPEAVDSTFVSAGYFDTVEVAILAGRAIDERDGAGSPRVAVVSQAFVQRYLQGADPLVRRLRTDSGREFQIVGISADHKVRTVGEAPRPYVHFGLDQIPNDYGNLIFRTSGAAAPVLETVRRTLLELEPELVVMDAATLDRRLEITLFPILAGSALLGGLAGFTVLLAGVGLYGLIAYWVASRTREIGLRIALGARPAVVTAGVVRRGLVPVVAGLVAGTLLAVPVGRMLRGVLLGVEPSDPVSFVAAAVLLLLVAIVANLLPARRAARVDPLEALRQD
ncbi:MAG TPA: ABC transporter permease [Thermoanaerobaculia bacterium]|nr:ABC transporter permease [Thermoanaerobaculia bacterium]